MHIFPLGLPPKAPRSNIRRDAFEPGKDIPQLRMGQKPNFLKHFGVRFRTQNVVPPQPPIERYRFGELRHIRCRAAIKASAARYRRAVFHAFEPVEFAMWSSESHC